MGGGGGDGGVTACTSGLGCILMAADNVCGACGGAGQPCCGSGNNGTCSTGFACSGRMGQTGAAGSCTACGAAGQPCCGNGANACTAGLVCRTMMCVEGEAGVPDGGGVVDATSGQ
jgi:hypothetical protein